MHLTFSWKGFYASPVISAIELIIVPICFIALTFLLFKTIDYLFFYPARNSKAYLAIISQLPNHNYTNISLSSIQESHNYKNTTQHINNTKTNNKTKNKHSKHISQMSSKSFNSQPFSNSKASTASTMSHYSSRINIHDHNTNTPNDIDSNSFLEMKQSISKINKTNKYSKILLVLSIFWAVIYSFCAFLTVYAIICFDLRSIDCGIRSVISIFYSFQRVCLITLFLLRLYLTTKDSVMFAINRKFFISCAIFLFTNYLFGGLIYMLFAFDYNNGFVCDWNVIVIPLAIVTTIDFCSNVFLGSMFLYKLKQIRDFSLQLYNQPQRLLLKQSKKSDIYKLECSIKKLFVLWIVSIFGTLLSMSLVYFITYSMCCLEMLCANVCLWLTFTFNDKYYRKFCHCCVVLTATASGNVSGNDNKNKSGKNDRQGSFYMKMDDSEATLTEVEML